jgi:hypothetical protein
MVVSQADQRVLQGLAAAREQHEELASLLDFYSGLYEVAYKAKAEIAAPEVRDELAMSWRLEGGIPQLAFGQLGLAAETFSVLVHDLSEVLLRYNPGWDFDWDLWTPEKLVDLAREVFETWDTLTSPRPEEGASDKERLRPGHPTALAVGFALAPFLQRAAEEIGPRLDLTDWTHGYCPICGGTPNLALLEAETGARKLLCSRCNFQWGYSRLNCPLCGTSEKQTYYPSEDGFYRLYVCPQCGRYLKTLDLREARREVIPIVERLLTVGMDLAAQEKGFGD